MIKVTHNADKMQSKAKVMGKNAAKLKVAHHKIATLLDAWVHRNFKTSGGNVGGWKPFKRYCVGGPRSPYGLSKTCAVGRVVGKGASRKIDTSANMLRDSGDLDISFKPFHDEKEAGVGSKKKYSKPHEKGLGHLPKRRMLPNEKDVKKQVKRIYEDHIKWAVK